MRPITARSAVRRIAKLNQRSPGRAEPRASRSIRTCIARTVRTSGPPRYVLTDGWPSTSTSASACACASGSSASRAVRPPITLAARRHHGRGLDHQDHGLGAGARPVHDASGDGVALVAGEHDDLDVAGGALDVELERAVEHDEALVLVLVLVPVVLALDDAEPDDRIVDLG